MNYIGGEFIENDFEGYLSDSNAQVESFFHSEENDRLYFETASDGLAAMIEEISGGKEAVIFFPDNYCRQTVHVILHKVSNKMVAPFFYQEITELFEKKNHHNSIRIALIMHFNGTFDVKGLQCIDELKDNFTVIEDFVQHPFGISGRKTKYAVNSLRKILPLEIAVTFGLSKNTVYSSSVSGYYHQKKQAVKMKAEFIKESSDQKKESKYLTLFKKAEEAQMNPNIFLGQEAELKIFNKLNFDKILIKRRKNYKFLYERLLSLNGIEIVPGDYFFMMILTKHQQKIKRSLAQKGIFTSIHWQDSETPFSKLELSIPIDQRYGIEDMERIYGHLCEILRP